MSFKGLRHDVRISMQQHGSKLRAYARPAMGNPQMLHPV